MVFRKTTNKKKPQVHLPSALSHPPKPSAHEVSGTAHFCCAQEKRNSGSTLVLELSVGPLCQPGEKMSDSEGCQEGAEGVSQVGDESPGENER